MNKQQEPRLRFKGFTGAWKEQKIIEIAEYVDYRGKTPRKTEEGIFLITAKNVKMGSLDYKVSQEFIAIEDFESVMSRGKAEIGDVLITTEAPLGNVAQIDREDVALAQRVIKYRGIKGILNNDFLTQKFLTNTFQATLGSLSSGGTVQGIKGSLLHQIEIKYPSLPEQTHLGLFFRRLDSQIAESRAVLEKSHQLKKAMLAKMFPANGEKIPQIRFKGFAGEWESRKLGIEVEIIGGGTPDTTNSAYWNGDIDWYSPTEIGEAAYANGSVKKITLLGLQKSSAQILPANRTVLFTSRASIGDMAILTRDGATNQGFQSFVVGERLDVYFLYTMGFKIKDYALKNASGSTFLEISKNTLSQMEFFAPSLKEQTAIGNFFRQLDETIALQSAEVEKLNQLKKGLLAAMLV
ncbi:TPA: restriction endonuclease subunit S [Neisseria subflava]|jgi:restriction modification system DNA specificity domain protein|uniref:restriction endonuclease subunit S n=1 Tax=Neisseria TaxID=482 RepID=UPI000D31BD43|nr:restriction endonuclease subunit S [Neisseria subflava]